MVQTIKKEAYEKKNFAKQTTHIYWHNKETSALHLNEFTQMNAVFHSIILL